MPTRKDAEPVPRRSLWTGRILSVVAVLFLAFDIVIKLLQIAPVTESFERLGYPPDIAFGLGLLELACLVLYVVPRTSVVGAILLTGFLGGATATHTRVGDPFFSHVLFPAYVGLLVWGGLLLREARLRVLVPLRSDSIA
ncbi:MAG TPA: DoxX family protein [Thermoanaerobaculia bacterium]|nr:DoxX family protein [Thermoanaerobaculia bacterium]